MFHAAIPTIDDVAVSPSRATNRHPSLPESLIPFFPLSLTSIRLKGLLRAPREWQSTNLATIAGPVGPATSDICSARWLFVGEHFGPGGGFKYVVGASNFATPAKQLR